MLGGTYGAGGVGFPGGEYRYATVDAGRGGTVLEKIRADGGTIKRYRAVGRGWSLPAVTWHGEAGGLSADGTTLALIKPPRARASRGDDRDSGSSTPARCGRPRRSALDGDFSFDAISPDGGRLYLVHYPTRATRSTTRCARYDVARGQARGEPIVDPDEPDEQMAGYPCARTRAPTAAGRTRSTPAARRRSSTRSTPRA